MVVKKIAASSLAVALAGSMIAGCSSKTSTTTEPTAKPAESAAASTTPKEPTSIKGMTMIFGNVPETTNNPAKAEIEKRANVKLNNSIIPNDVYLDKLGIEMTNPTHDFVTFYSKDALFMNYAKQGAFHDLTPYLKNLKNLNAMPESFWDYGRVKDKIYGVPRTGGPGTAVMIRKDWLDKYGLQVPKTLDEYTKMLRVFKEKDPVGGGKTIPLILHDNFDDADHVKYAFGVPVTWKIENGKPVRDFQTPEYKEYMDWLRMAYKDGLINNDVLVTKFSQMTDKFKAGLVGSFRGTVSGLGGDIPVSVKKVDPKAEVTVITHLEAPKATGSIVDSLGFFYAIPVTVPKDKIPAILGFMDFMSSPEMIEFARTGLKDIHYSEVKDGIVVRNQEQSDNYGKKDRPNEVAGFRAYNKYLHAQAIDPAINKKQRELVDFISSGKLFVRNPFDGMQSETNRKNPDNDKSLKEINAKYIMGDITWEQAMKGYDEWMQKYGNKMGEELMQQYNELKK